MKTTHRIELGDARQLRSVNDGSVELVVTSPPYPMVEMWDGAFAELNEEVGKSLEADDYRRAFELMHLELDKVWRECFRVLRPGGIACINIGDATRTLSGEFQLFSNHSRIVTSATALGFVALPDLIWRKQTNAPNKFLGSGMLPPGAYVTYEHEYILVFRKGGKRHFDSDDEKTLRRRSAYFWEERNQWFSDVWFDLKGAAQSRIDPSARSRSGAFPFELAYRLIQMFSIIGDTVLDPFLGTGTSTLAAVCSARSSIGVEVKTSLVEQAASRLPSARELGIQRVRARLDNHRQFVNHREADGRPLKYTNRHYQIPVQTKQERELELFWPDAIRRLEGGAFEASHSNADPSPTATYQSEFPEINSAAADTEEPRR